MVKSDQNALYSVEDVHLQITGKTILERINLSIQSGVVTGLLGPNGAGKTSLLRILSGEWHPSNGVVKFRHKPINEWTPHELGRHRAFLHQESSLDFAFTVEEVVLLGRSPHMSDSERPQDYEIAHAALAAVDMETRKTDAFTSLSGGEKQRVHLARCLAQIWNTPNAPDQRCLFLDEPTNNLDLAHQYSVFKVARNIAREGTAVVMVLHDLNQAFQFCDRLFILNRGKIALEGKPKDLFSHSLLPEIFNVRIQSLQQPGQQQPYFAFSPR